MIRKLIPIALMMLCISQATKAQTPTYPFASRSGLALVAGLTSGIGIGYREHFDNHLGVQIATAGVYTGEWAGANVGANMFYSFVRGSLARVYLVVGTSFYYTGSKLYNYPEPVSPPSEKPAAVQPAPIVTWENSFYWNAGVGVGIEFHFTDNIGWSIDAPLSATTKIGRDGLSFVSVLPIPSTSVSYYF